MHRFIALDGDDVIRGLASAWHTGGRRWRMDLAVDPSMRRLGIGSALLGQATRAVLAAGGRTLQARTHAGSEEALDFLRHRGFVETMRMHFLELPLMAARDTDARLEASTRRLAAAGIEIRTLADELVTGTGVWDRIAALYEAGHDDWPDPDPGDDHVPMTGEEARRKFTRWDVDPAFVFIAVAGDVDAGFSGLGCNGRPIGTAVRPEFRNRGIATALKMHIVRKAAEAGIDRLVTGTGNPAMLRVNENLGYRRTGIEVRLVKRIPY